MRPIVAACLAVAAGLFAYASLAGLIGPSFAALGLAILAAALVAWRAPRIGLASGRVHSEDLRSPAKPAVLACGVAALAALLVFARLTVFMVDPDKTGWSFAPSSDWETRHACITAYHVAAEASHSVANVYDDALYSEPGGDRTAPRKPRRLGLFNIDVFEYPPPFLLLPRALQLLAPDFVDLRRLWFGLSGGVMLVALVAVARFPRPGDARLLFPVFVWASVPTWSAFQKENVQVMVIAAAMLAMLLFERRREAAGGALLAFVTVSKLYPGLLVVYLLARRRYRAVAWTAGLSAAFVLASLVLFGAGTYQAFLDQLPRLLSGEAFPALRNPGPIARNLSIPGLLFKAKLFGASGVSYEAAGHLGTVYMLVALGLTVMAGLRGTRDEDKPLVWLAVLILATLRSPFLPDSYGLLPGTWLLTLLAARRADDAKTLWLALAGWLALSFYWPFDWPMDLRLVAMLTTAQQAVMIGLVVLALRRTRAPAMIPVFEAPLAPAATA
jgi:hypothetical protein